MKTRIAELQHKLHRSNMPERAHLIEMLELMYEQAKETLVRGTAATYAHTQGEARLLRRLVDAIKNGSPVKQGDE